MEGLAADVTYRFAAMEVGIGNRGSAESDLPWLAKKRC